MALKNHNYRFFNSFIFILYLVHFKIFDKHFVKSRNKYYAYILTSDNK